MKKTLTLIAASTALTAAIGIPAWSAIEAPANGVLQPVAALFDDASETLPFILASGDDDDDDRRWRKSSRGHDDDEDHDDDDDDDDDQRGGARNPAPAGTVAPPQNGLFGTGTPPKVRVN